MRTSSMSNRQASLLAAFAQALHPHHCSGSSLCSCPTVASQPFGTPTVSADMAHAVEVFVVDKVVVRLSTMSHVSYIAMQVLTNIETAQRQNRLFDALKQGNAALKPLQQVCQLRPLIDISIWPVLQSTLLLFMTRV